MLIMHGTGKQLGCVRVMRKAQCCFEAGPTTGRMLCLANPEDKQQAATDVAGAAAAAAATLLHVLLL